MKKGFTLPREPRKASQRNYYSNELRDLPDGPVVKNSPSNAENAGLIPGGGIKIPHAAGQLSSHGTGRSGRRSVVSDCLQPHGLYSPWNSSGQNTGVGSRSLLQGIFPTQGSNPGLPHCRQILYQPSHQRRPHATVKKFSWKKVKTNKKPLRAERKKWEVCEDRGIIRVKSRAVEEKVRGF